MFFSGFVQGQGQKSEQKHETKKLVGFHNQPTSINYDASNIHGYNTRYAAKHNLYKPSVRTKVGKQLISFMATDIWKELPGLLKKLIQSVSAFPKQIIRYQLLSEQQMNSFSFMLTT